ncbi:MAG: site-2 protease family protein [archaeon]
MNFIIYDIGLLVIFAVFSSILLYKKRKKLIYEGAFILYKTKWGINLIDRIGKNHKKTLNALSYLSISLGYLLMISVIYLMIKTTYLYFTTSIAKQIKVPPIMPIVPYIDKLIPGFPSFYFVYFIVAIVIVATVHEFAHGIFARCYNIKIKSTGFAFLKYFPAFFGAFVEQDEKQMPKRKKLEQMSVLSAGVFANLLTAILFLIALVLFFSLTFSSGGVMFTTYSYSIVNISDIYSVNGISIDEPDYEKILLNTEEGVLNNISSKERNYLITREDLGKQKSDYGILVLYDDAPAIRENISNLISEINGVEIKSLKELENEISKYSPGDSIKIKSKKEDFSREYEIILEENPHNNKPWIGIGFESIDSSGILGKIRWLISYFKNPYVYYKPDFKISLFVYDFLWWIILINFAVALFNMLPIGALDGGRFFYLTLLGLTKSEKIAKKCFSLATFFIFFLFLLLMVRWISIFLFKL